MEYKIKKYGLVESTNTLLKEMTGAGAGTVIIATAQSMGRGRMGRSFVSDDGGLYMSVCFEPETVDEQLFIPIRAAVAVHRAISEFCECSIKWPNDILISEKKVCGILAEAQGKRVILGIGVNIKTAPDYAVSLFQATKKDISCDELSDKILQNLSSKETDSEIISYYRKNCAMLGKSINVIGATETYEAKALDVNEKGELEILCGDVVKTINSGEVSVRTA